MYIHEWNVIFSHEEVGDQAMESAEFPKYMTPLMLACHHNDYEMVRLLLQRGQTIDMKRAQECK